MKKIKTNKGITLITLATTIVLLLIISSIAIYSGKEVMESANFTAFETELKIMQTQVNSLYEKQKNGEKVIFNGQEKNVSEIGTDINDCDDIVKDHADEIFTEDASEITDKENHNYKYFDNDTIKGLGIEGVQGSYFIDIGSRSLVSYAGFNYGGKTYYTLQQLPAGLYNVEARELSSEKPTFDTSIEKIDNTKWKISINNIKYEGNINKWKLMYREVVGEGQGTWYSTDNNYIYIKKEGDYQIKISNNEVESLSTNIIARKVSDEYQQVSYIGLDTTSPQNTYIDTDIQIKDISNIVCKYSYEDFWGEGDPIILSSINSEDNTDITPWISSDGEKSEDGMIIEPIKEKEESLLATEFSIGYNVNSDNKLKIGGGNNVDNTPIGKYYYVRIKDNNNELVFNGIPCYRKNDNNENIEIGIYNLINNTFYTTSLTEKFNKGDNVINKELDNSIVVRLLT